jgi:magnesium-protoporphyrin O-methyltransferase
VDISRGYVTAARELAQSLGFAERAEHRELDIAQDPGDVPPADIVILNRVICCYPNLPALLLPAAQRTRRLLALVFPREAWWVRFGIRAINFWLWLMRRDFRAFAHPNAEVIRLANANGLRTVLDECSGPWRTMLFER